LIKTKIRSSKSFNVLAKAASRNLKLIAVLLSLNLVVAFFEGSSLGLFAIAVSVLVGDGTLNITSQFGRVGALIEGYLSPFDQGDLFLILVAIGVATQVLKSALLYLSKRVSIILGFRVSKDLQDQTTNQIMRLTYSEVSSRPTGSLSETINQAGNVSVLLKNLNDAILAIIMLIVYVGLMLLVSIELTVVAVAILAILGFGMNRIIRHLKKLGTEFTEASIETGKRTVEYLQVPKLLRIFGVTEFARKSISESRTIALETNKNASLVRALADPVIEIATVVGGGALLIFGYLMSTESSVESVSKLFMFFVALYRAMPQVRVLNHIRMTTAIFLSMLKVVADLIFIDDSAISKTSGIKISSFSSGVEFDNLDFCYPGADTNTLMELSFCIPKGKTVAVVGPSGAGKSTMANLILKLYNPTCGVISVDGVNLEDIDTESWLNLIGCVDQDGFLLNASVHQNISFGTNQYTGEEVARAAKLAHAEKFIDVLPDKYGTNIGDRGYKLSGGQQQRIALARALIRNPSLLVLDEATNSLDSETENLVQKTISGLRGSHTMFVIAHRISTISNADEIIVLDKGRIVDRGRDKDLTKRNGLYARLRLEQFH